MSKNEGLRKAKQKANLIRRCEIAQRYLSGESIKNICKAYNISDETVAQDLKKLGIKPKSSKKYIFNESIFEKINTEEKAYWLGFIFAEGNIYKNTLSIKLGEDKEHLDKFCHFMKTNYNVEVGKNKNGVYYRARFYSKKICEDLKEYGVIPKKSTIIKMPNLDEKYISHFIRGFFDGDGWFGYNKNTDRWNLGMCSCSYEFINKLNETFEIFIGFKLSYFKRNYKDKPQWNSLYTISCGGKSKIASLLEFMYNDCSIYLDRKFEIMKEIKKWIKDRNF